MYLLLALFHCLQLLLPSFQVQEGKTRAKCELPDSMHQGPSSYSCVPVSSLPNLQMSHANWFDGGFPLIGFQWRPETVGFFWLLIKLQSKLLNF